MQNTRFFMTTMIVLGLAFAAVADDTQKDTQTVDAKAEDGRRAKFVDFAMELGLPIAALDTLGEQIDSARLASDPVDLAVAAKLLEAAEAAAGKKGSLTAETILTEAVDLAKERGNPAELSTIAKLVGGPAAADLEAVAEAAADREAEAGESTRDLDGDLYVINHSHSELHVYVDGYEVGHVAPHGSRSFHVHHAHHVVARDHYGHRWTAHLEYGHYHHYVMRVHEPHFGHHGHH
ncbi:MAG: hypothetical protein KDA93_22085 [Planctomycetaceae bacterium]|nr:hypothetical protein [Planctomycetaceae bacterium]